MFTRIQVILEETGMPRSLWQILVSLAEPDSRLTCEECFAVLDYYADQLEADADPDELHEQVAQHLARCSDCQVEMMNWIEAL
jgi:hypothetical protein